MTTQRSDEAVRLAVRETYADIARNDTRGCGCGCASDARAPGYSRAERASLPEGADLGLGVGNPVTLAALQPGQSVLDLGSGAGIDSFLAARQVGASGRVIGVDMTPEMVAKARASAGRGNYANVEFRLAEIEHLPVADRSIDVIMSNCVVNLSPDKAAVYREAFRVLRPGGRMAISDVVTTAELPDDARNDLALIARCVSGAATVTRLRDLLDEVGFRDVSIRAADGGDLAERRWEPGTAVTDYVVAAAIEAHKPLS